MPPFFLRDATDDGVARFFEALLERTTPPARHVLLYNFPAMSGVAFRLPLLQRLMTAFPDAFGGIKDSSNDRELQRAIVAAYPALRVFPSSEVGLPELEAFGAAGCISATVALSSAEAARAFALGDSGDAHRVSCRRQAFTGIPLIAGVRHLLARKRNDASWERMLPPLSPLTPAQGDALCAAFNRCA
jgi:4-hydroxy-tetrahydrodipicolinate synthase